MLAAFAIQIYGDDHDTWHGTVCLKGGERVNFKSTAELYRLMDERIRKTSGREKAKQERKNRSPILKGRTCLLKEEDRMIEEIMFLLDKEEIRVWQDAGEDSAKCQIKECWFRFASIDENTSLEGFATDELAELIADAINHPQVHGMTEDDAEYCRATISICYLSESYKI